MGDGINFTDVGQKLIAQPFAFAGAFDQTGDIDKGHARWNDLFAGGNACQCFQPSVGNGNFADVRLNCAKWEIRGLRCGGSRQSVKQC